MSQFRYERKYIIENLSTQKVNLIIKSHPHLFKKKYDARFVNSLYLDSLDYSFYNDHVIGKSDRYKIRVRWYNNLYEEIQKPVLEIKTKKNGVYFLIFHVHLEMVCIQFQHNVYDQ